MFGALFRLTDSLDRCGSEGALSCGLHSTAYFGDSYQYDCLLIEWTLSSALSQTNSSLGRVNRGTKPLSLTPKTAAEFVRAGAVMKLLVPEETQGWIVLSALIRQVEHLVLPKLLLRYLSNALLDGQAALQLGALTLASALVQQPEVTHLLLTPPVMAKLFSFLSSTEPVLQRKAVTILRYLCSKHGYAPEPSGFPIIVALLGSESEKIVLRALAILKSLSRDWPSIVSESLVSLGKMGEVISLLSSPVYPLSEGALSLLQRIANLEELKAFALAYGAVPKLSRLLTEPPGIPAYRDRQQFGSLQVLSALSAGVDAKLTKELKGVMINEGLLETAMELLKSLSPRSQRTALGLLANLCHTNEPNRLKLLNSEAVPLLLSLLKTTDQALQQSAACTLWAISYSRASIPVVLNAHGLDTLIALMSSPVKKTQSFSVGCLRNLSHDNACKVAIVEGNGLPALIKLLGSPVDVKGAAGKLKESVVGTLWNLSSTPKNDLAFARELPLCTLLELAGKTENLKVVAGIVNLICNLFSAKDSPLYQPLLFTFLSEGGLPILKCHRLLSAAGQSDKSHEECDLVRQKIDQLNKRCLEFKDMMYILLLSKNFNTRVAAAISIALNVTQFPGSLRAQGTIAKIFDIFRQAVRRDGVDNGPIEVAHVFNGLQAFFTTVGRNEPPQAITAAQAPGFQPLFNSSKFSDVQFVVEGRVLYGHRVVLSLASQFFEKMFTSPMRESTAAAITIHDKSPAIFEKVLQSCYSGSVTITSVDEAVQLLLAADQYLLPQLRLQSESYLGTHMDMSNLEDLLAFAQQYGFDTLKEACLEWILGNAETVLRDHLLDSFPVDRLLDVVNYVEHRFSRTSSELPLTPID